MQEISNLIKPLSYAADSGMRSIIPRAAAYSLGWLRQSCVTTARPIFIWGTGRSGTHLLYDAMSVHPDLCFVAATKRWKKGVWGGMHHGEQVPEQLNDYPIPVEGPLYIWEGSGVHFDFHGFMENSNVSMVTKEIINSKYQSLATVWKWQQIKKEYRFLDKSPLYLMMIELINQLFPDAFHVFCIRDPRATVNSILRIARFTGKEQYESAYADGFFSYMRPDGYREMLGKSLVEVLCWQIEALIKKGASYRTLLGDRLIFFRYEELVASGHRAIRELFARTGLSEVSGLERLIPGQFENYNPNWSERRSNQFPTYELCFDASEVHYFNGLEQLAEDLGYAPENAGAIRHDIDIRRICA